MGKVTILDYTTKTPLQLMGAAAGFAYNSDTTNPEKNRKRGLQCVKDGHGRMLEYPDVYFNAEGYSCRMARELFRHVGDGLTVVQRSTRYVDEQTTADSSLAVNHYTPPLIEKNPDAADVYYETMKNITDTYRYMINLGISKEDAANILPLGLETQFCMKKNARNLYDMAGVRLCSRALLEYRQFMRDLERQLRDYSEEWNILCDIIFKPKCERMGYCDESMSCGRYPKKED